MAVLDCVVSISAPTGMLYSVLRRCRRITRLHRSLVFLASCVAALVLCHTVGAVERGFTDKFCIDPPHDMLCSQLPFDQADFSRDFSYMLIEKGAQDPFDIFAWQAFVALNWPSDRSGNPLQAAIGARPDARHILCLAGNADDIGHAAHAGRLEPVIEAARVSGAHAGCHGDFLWRFRKSCRRVRIAGLVPGKADQDCLCRSFDVRFQKRRRFFPLTGQNQIQQLAVLRE